MYPHDLPRVSVFRGSAAQRDDGNLRVRAPGLRSRAFPVLDATPVAQLMTPMKIHSQFSRSMEQDVSPRLLE
jgi:hypothetical protein